MTFSDEKPPESRSDRVTWNFLCTFSSDPFHTLLSSPSSLLYPPVPWSSPAVFLGVLCFLPVVPHCPLPLLPFLSSPVIFACDRASWGRRAVRSFHGQPPLPFLRGGAAGGLRGFVLRPGGRRRRLRGLV